MDLTSNASRLAKGRRGSNPMAHGSSLGRRSFATGGQYVRSLLLEIIVWVCFSVFRKSVGGCFGASTTATIGAVSERGSTVRGSLPDFLSLPLKWNEQVAMSPCRPFAGLSEPSEALCCLHAGDSATKFSTGSVSIDRSSWVPQWFTAGLDCSPCWPSRCG